MRPRCLLLVLAAVVRAGAAVASPPSDSVIARQAREALARLTNPDGPGAVVLVARGDQVIFREARGHADIELGVPLSPDHVFRIASLTKVFTAATILKLADTGTLSVDDSLATFLPDFPNAGSITVRQLLNHTAGISDVARDPQPGFGRRDVDLATRVAGIRNRPLDFPPGTRWAYSNSGYILLGAVIEKVTGEQWHAALQRQLLAPLGLKRTLYGAHSPLIPGRAAGYTTDRQTGRVSNAPFISMTIPASAGALASTVDDLFLWMRALTTGRVIRPETLRDMVTAPHLPGIATSSRYGLGVSIWHVRGTPMIGHTGQIDGFAAALAHLPEQDVTVVVLANDDTIDARVMSRRLAAIALGEPYPEVAAVPPSEEELRALEGTYGSDEATRRTLSVRDRTLHARRGGGNSIPLQMTADKRLHFVPDELSYFSPVRDAAGSITRLDYFEGGDGPPLPLPRLPASAAGEAAARTPAPPTPPVDAPAGEVSPGVHIVRARTWAEKIDLSPPSPGGRGGVSAQDEGWRVHAAERDAPGVAELHENDTDVWYVIAGGATLVTGGTLVDASLTGAGEHRAPSIRGGTEHTVAAGDVISIRPGVPHWVKAVDGRVRYLTVKVLGRPAPAGTAR